VTHAEFFEALEHTPRAWRVTSGGKIRLYDEAKREIVTVWEYCRCPITAVAWARLQHVYSTGQAPLAARHLDLPGPVAETILRAADTPGAAYPETRAKLLAACGLPLVSESRELVRT